MKYTVNQIKKILSDYLAVTEPELIFGFNNTVYEDNEILGVCLDRDWDNVTVFRCLPDLSKPCEVIERYLSEKRMFPNQQAWSEAVLDYCLSYLKEEYEEKWIRFEPKEQDQPYFRLNDGSFLALSIARGLHGIVVEISENEEQAYNYMFEDADIIYEGFDRIDALRQLKDCISDCWSDYINGSLTPR